MITSTSIKCLFCGESPEVGHSYVKYNDKTREVIPVNKEDKGGYFRAGLLSLLQ